MRTLQEMMPPLQTAFLMVTCEAGHESDVVEQIRSVSGIGEACRTSGTYDILCSIEATTVESLREIIEQKIRKTPHVIATTTLIKSH
ncbi:MAG TPA: Lrp/AsnC ligand binding domain-containing protein [Candidatus Nitrosotalea sp.]|nr:Lrp/AsnC ligand binding domain-containing protein [Candidatus Nitrosotalea sp.]